MKSVLSIIGTRPEAIKMAPVLRELERRTGEVRSIACLTGQHRELVDQALHVFAIRADHDLAVMQPNQSLAQLTANLIAKLDPLVRELQPDWVLAQGDTTTVFVASLVAFYNGVRFGHVEAGLRSGSRTNPFPEEVNRRLADVIADLHFVPTERARAALLREGHDGSSIVTTGNTVIDALREVSSRPHDASRGPLAAIPRGKRLVLVTIHRRESFGEPLKEICRALREVAERVPEAHLVWPVHPNPNVRGVVHEVLGGVASCTLLDPLDYVALVQVMKRSRLIVTDSGGIQEEAPFLAVPVLVVRETTERPEAIEAGVARLVGTARAAIVESACELLTDDAAHGAMARHVSPYGDGHAAPRIVERLLSS
jgi:UDP-N-acetylglucosamine 2-epimerase (non-hydrolysing)